MAGPARRRPPTTKEAWAKFANAEREERPEGMSLGDYRALKPSDRRAYDERRATWHATLGPYALGSARRIFDRAEELLADNDLLPADKVRPGAAIDGEPNLGKTTILRAIGRRHERGQRERHGWHTEEGDEYYPVGHVALPRGSYISGLNEKLAAFYNLPRRSRENQDDLTRRIVECMWACRTELVLVDDIHFAMGRGKRPQDLNDHLKHLMNEVAATFVVAGVDLAREGFFEEGKGPAKGRVTQIGDRFSHYPVDRLRIDVEADAKQWWALLHAIGNDLVLLVRGEALTSKRMREYLFKRTGGSIGRVMELLRKASLRAMAEERRKGGSPTGITRELLEGIQLSYSAENGSAARTGQREAIKAGR